MGLKGKKCCQYVKASEFPPGFFSVDAGDGTHHYILQESGNVINVDKQIEKMNNINWIEVGYKEGDTFSVYGNEYVIDRSGHINDMN